MKYYLLLLLTSFLWGGNFIVGKTLVDHTSPITLTILRWVIAIICLIPLVWWKEKKLIPPRESILPLFIMGVTGVALFQALQFMALEKTSATNVGLISTLNMFSIAAFSFFFLKEKINKLQFLTMILSLFGVLLVLSKGNMNVLFSLQFNKGDLYMMMAVGMWGIYSVSSKWAMATVTPMMSILYSGIFGLLVLLPFSINDFTVTNLNSSFMQGILYTGLVSTVLCMVLWNIGVNKLGPSTSGLFLNFNPIFTAVLAFAFLGENMTWIQAAGSVIVIAGCFLFTLLKNKPVRFMIPIPARILAGEDNKTKKVPVPR
ncbi:DMT family transporter [Mesobacillus selenatarsenatis]|uniref:Permease of the drug/metabolite transporter (DMT) superfamily n=1 Tax=Mesobacillus selenatarsenatis (strain DSM 18680 / JCM 14380 / FERM P-15431 / SF-1) TaxID=1321606 RepID=A0A0A8X9J6_MESS1|nr:DMT family transporter [Mesobacillus selenatarsenatis]GAM15899.1 permease of the drug/metabolite transporter (DMT) superfamily [Mesobacillus selenatarsenatis SF-1]